MKQPGPETMANVLQSTQQYLPGVIEAISAQQPAVARMQAEVDRDVSPIYANTQADIFDTAGRRLAETGREISSADQLASAKTESDILSQFGPDLVAAATRLMEQADPEYAAQRRLVADANTKLLASQDPTQLSGSERGEVEKAVARQGDTNPNSTVNTVENAMTYGSALADKQSRFGETVARIAATLPTLRSGIDAFQVATRRPAVPNAGTANFVGGQQGAGQNAWNTGNQFFQNASQMQAEANARKGSVFDSIIKGANAAGGLFSFA